MKNFIIIFFVICSVACVKNQEQIKQIASNDNDVTAAWSPNTENDLAGYKVYRGTSSRNYDFSVVVNAPDTSIIITGLVDGVTYYFAVTAFDKVGNESEMSSEATITIPVPDINPPAIPKNFNITLVKK